MQGRLWGDLGGCEETLDTGSAASPRGEAGFSFENQPHVLSSSEKPSLIPLLSASPLIFGRCLYHVVWFVPLFAR